MAESDRFLQTIELIHGAGLEGGRWAEALAAVSGLFGSLGATLEVFEKKPIRVIDLHIAGLPPQAETEYLNHYANHNPRAAYAFRNLAEVTLCDYQLIDERTMDRDAYYAKYLRSLDLRYFLSGQIMNTPEIQGIVSIQRSRRQGHVERRDVERMLRLLPHVRQAYDVATRLKRADAVQRSLEGALDWLNDGVALLGPDGRLLHANDAFQEIAGRSDGIRVVRRRVEFAAAEARNRFAKAFAAAARVDADEAADFMAERKSGPPYLISLRSAVPTLSARQSRREAIAILFVHDPLTRSGSAISAMQHTFGLTEAEKGFAQALLAGLSPAEYARDHAISRNTVYTHLRRIKEKTGSARLPELIRRLSDALPAVRSILPALVLLLVP